jgi:hypothetical protein
LRHRIVQSLDVSDDPAAVGKQPAIRTIRQDVLLIGGRRLKRWITLELPQFGPSVYDVIVRDDGFGGGITLDLTRSRDS